MDKRDSFQRLFVNSYPKAGTFLLLRAVELLGFRDFLKKDLFNRVLNRLGFGVPPSLIHESIKGNMKFRFLKRFYRNPQATFPVGVTSPLYVPEDIVRRYLNRIPKGYCYSGHVPYSEVFDRILKDLGYKHILILRDPRDILVSFIHYVVKPEHQLSPDFRDKSFDERIELALSGGYCPLSKREITGIGDAYRSILKWRLSDNCCIVKFEELIGEKGGGSDDLQYKTLKNICNYLELNLTDDEIFSTGRKIFDVNSPTFRKGQIASWKEELPIRWQNVFNKRYGDILKEVGYEVI